MTRLPLHVLLLLFLSSSYARKAPSPDQPSTIQKRQLQPSSPDASLPLPPQDALPNLLTGLGALPDGDLNLGQAGPIVSTSPPTPSNIISIGTPGKVANSRFVASDGTSQQTGDNTNIAQAAVDNTDPLRPPVPSETIFGEPSSDIVSSQLSGINWEATSRSAFDLSPEKNVLDNSIVDSDMSDTEEVQPSPSVSMEPVSSATSQIADSRSISTSETQVPSVTTDDKLSSISASATDLSEIQMSALPVNDGSLDDNSISQERQQSSGKILPQLFDSQNIFNPTEDVPSPSSDVSLDIDSINGGRSRVALKAALLGPQPEPSVTLDSDSLPNLIPSGIADRIDIGGSYAIVGKDAVAVPNTMSQPSSETAKPVPNSISEHLFQDAFLTVPTPSSSPDAIDIVPNPITAGKDVVAPTKTLEDAIPPSQEKLPYLVPEAEPSLEPTIETNLVSNSRVVLKIASPQESERALPKDSLPNLIPAELNVDPMLSPVIESSSNSRIVVNGASNDGKFPDLIPDNVFDQIIDSSPSPTPTSELHDVIFSSSNNRVAQKAATLSEGIERLVPLDILPNLLPGNAEEATGTSFGDLSATPQPSPGHVIALSNARIALKEVKTSNTNVLTPDMAMTQDLPRPSCRPNPTVRINETFFEHDIVFILDSSEGMQGYLESLAKYVDIWLDTAMTSLTRVDVRVALVTFGGPPQLRMIFTNDLTQFKLTLYQIAQNSGQKYGYSDQEAGLEAIRVTLSRPELLSPECFSDVPSSLQQGSDKRVPGITSSEKYECVLRWREDVSKSVFLITDEDSDLPTLLDTREAGQTTGYPTTPIPADSFLASFKWDYVEPVFIPAALLKWTPSTSFETQASSGESFQYARSQPDGFHLSPMWNNEIKTTANVLLQTNTKLALFIRERPDPIGPPRGNPISDWGDSNPLCQKTHPRKFDDRHVIQLQYGLPDSFFFDFSEQNELILEHDYEPAAFLAQLNKKGLGDSLQGLLLQAKSDSIRVYPIEWLDEQQDYDDLVHRMMSQALNVLFESSLNATTDPVELLSSDDIPFCFIPSTTSTATNDYSQSSPTQTADMSSSTSTSSTSFSSSTILWGSVAGGIAGVTGIAAVIMVLRRSSTFRSEARHLQTPSVTSSTDSLTGSIGQRENPIYRGRKVHENPLYIHPRQFSS